MGFMRAPGGAVVELFEFAPAAKTAGPVWNAPGLTHLALDVAGVAAWTTRLKAEGLSFVTEPQRTEGVDWVFLRDPDGNLVELIDLGPKRPALRIVGGLLGSLKKRGDWAAYYAGR
jgi:catechol 2,3-dioxygenase-like lactoylglutathione lyase family enzyme